MNFRGKRFEYIEYATGYEGNRGNFAKLSDVEKLVWTKHYGKKELWRTMYSYCDINHLEVSFGPYYFESDIPDFETNRKVVLYAVHYLNVKYDIPIEAFKFKFTNKSVWVEIIPSVMGISPSYNLNEIFREITFYLNKTVYETLGIRDAFDTNVYSPRQFSRVVGSFLPQSQRYVIELTYHELASYPYQWILNMAKRPRKLTYPPNEDFFVSEEAKRLFEYFRNLVKQKKNLGQKKRILCGNLTKERLCLLSMEKHGVEKGNRNLALFYASVDKRDKGVPQEKWEKEAVHFMRNFEKEKIDSLSQIKATVKSAYKDKYVFSCRKIRENLPEHCDCEHCPFNRKKPSGSVAVFRKQLAQLLKNNATVQCYKDLFLLQYYKEKGQEHNFKTLKKYNELKKMGLLTSEGKINSVYERDSYIAVPAEFVHSLDMFKSELILYLLMLYCSCNGATLNPKMKTVHYAKKLGKSERTVQRHWKTLVENGWIDEKNRFCFTKEIPHKLVDLLPEEEFSETQEPKQEKLVDSVRKEKGRGFVLLVFPPVFEARKPEFVQQDVREIIAMYGQKRAAP